MPQTYTQILLHIVFSTKDRAATITPQIREPLYPYMGGIVRHEGGVLHVVGGMPDHVHMLIGWRPDITLSALMQKVKGGSSKWLHETIPDSDAMRWQGGYSAFSVSKSNESAVRAYIERQVEHHRTRSFKEELIALLCAHGVEFDEGQVFE